MLQRFNLTAINSIQNIIVRITLARFYDKTAFEEDGVEHVKIRCAGFGSVPNLEQVNKFVSICKIFWSKNPLKVIGVHCTHGFNRTGSFEYKHFIVRLGINTAAGHQQELSEDKLDTTRVLVVSRQFYT